MICLLMLIAKRQRGATYILYHPPPTHVLGTHPLSRPLICWHNTNATNIKLTRANFQCVFDSAYLILIRVRILPVRFLLDHKDPCPEESRSSNCLRSFLGTVAFGGGGRKEQDPADHDMQRRHKRCHAVAARVPTSQPLIQLVL